MTIYTERSSAVEGERVEPAGAGRLSEGQIRLCAPVEAETSSAQLLFLFARCMVSPFERFRTRRSIVHRESFLCIVSISFYFFSFADSPIKGKKQIDAAGTCSFVCLFVCRPGRSREVFPLAIVGLCCFTRPSAEQADKTAEGHWDTEGRSLRRRGRSGSCRTLET